MTLFPVDLVLNRLSCQEPGIIGTIAEDGHGHRKKPAVRPPCFSTAQPKGGKDEMKLA